MTDIRPNYYRGRSGQDVFDLVDDFELDFYSGNILKYVIRAGRKSPTKLDDLLKARTYINRLIELETKEK